MTSPNLTQLTQSPQELAPDDIEAFINPNSGVEMSDLVIDYQPGGKIIITPTQSSFADPNWRYYGHAVATFSQLDLGVVFGDFPIHLCISQVPARSNAVADLFAQIFDVLLTADDVVDEPLPTVLGGGTTYVLKASPSSVMWKGQRTVTLFPTTIETTDLTDLVLETTLDGLHGPISATPLSALTPNQVVPGLTLRQLNGGALELGDFVSDHVVNGLNLSQLQGTGGSA